MERKGTLWLGVNKAKLWLAEQIVYGMPTGARRTISLFWVLMFDFGPAVLEMISVFLFKKHEMMFNDNLHY
jgi:hypothetical protein